ncbi:MAG: T9SS type A sorting domain-containing protein [Chitinophagaceae bacterium]|nr:T9SS type A sorting domain-containing protein [Chitinophagaceae bacterium]
MKKGTAMLLSLITMFSMAASGQTWNGTVSSDWNNRFNWSTGEVPDIYENVTISNASAPYQPILSGNVMIGSLTMSHGILDLNGYTLTCSGNVYLTGDSLRNGKITAANFSEVANMRMGGKLVFDKTGNLDNYWSGNNKIYNDSLIVIWRTGTLYTENITADSIFTHLKIHLISGVIIPALNALLYVQNDLVIDNSGGGSIAFAANIGSYVVIGGNLIGLNFSGNHSNLFLRGITTQGNQPNGPFYCGGGSISTCSFNGNITLVADSSADFYMINSTFGGGENLFQAGGFSAIGGNTFSGNTLIRLAHNITDYTGSVTEGNNKFAGNVQFETDATAETGSARILHTYLGQDTCLGNATFILKNNSALYSNYNGNSYVAGNVIIDAQGAAKWVQFNSGTASYTIGGNFTAKNFTPYPVPGVAYTYIYLGNVTAAGTDTCGTFYCYTGNITNSSFNGNFKLIADSSQGYTINNAVLAGTDNLLQAGTLDILNSKFGSNPAGTTILRAAHNVAGNVYMRDGNNKFFGHVQYETFAAMPGGLTIQQTYYGADSCFGDLRFILKGNAALTTNGSGNSYVAGNVIIDGQGARKWVQFTGGAGPTFTIAGNFTAKNFTPYPEPGVGYTNILLRNVTAAGTDTCGTFYGYTGDITNSSFNGNFKLIGDSSQGYTINNSVLAGTDNLLQAGTLDILNSKFGSNLAGTTILRAAHNVAGNVFMRDGNNKFFGNVQYETFAVMPGGLTIQQTYYGADSCFGDLSFILKGNAALTTNNNGNSYVAGNVIIDGQGARKWVQFTGGAGPTFTIDGNFTAKNFTPYPEPGVGYTNILLRNVTAAGTDTCGTFYGYTGDITNSGFNGNFKLIADSEQVYSINNSVLSGADNWIQAGNLDIQNSRFGQMGIGTTVLRSAHDVAGNVYIREGNNKFSGNTEWDIIAPAFGVSIFQHTYYGQDSCLGDLTVHLAGPSSANLAGNNLYIGKGLSLQNNGTGVIVHDNASSAIYFIGSDTASYSYSGTGSAPSIRNIGMNRRGGVRLLSPLTCSGLTLSRGVILSSATNPLSIPDGAVVTGGGDSSYVDGPMIKTGNEAFIFPLGSNNIFAPISITAPALSTDQFTAQYVPRIAHDDGYDSTQHDVSLHHLSRSEYWLLNRTAGTSSPKVTLSWKTARSGEVNVINDLRVARWNGTTWKDEGKGITTGTNEEGTIQSLNDITSFSPFTLASSSVNNPLPVNYIEFVAIVQSDKTVLLKWETSEEINNAYYQVERSTDNRTWLIIALVNPNSSHIYIYTDRQPVQGINYYRIRQVDRDGQYTYTSIRLVKISNDKQLFIWPNPVTDHLNIQTPVAWGSIEIYDANGKMIWKKVISSTIQSVPLQNLPSGVYVIQVRYGNDKLAEKFIKQ